MAEASSTARPYWANERDPKALIARCMERFGWHMAALKSSGRWASMRSLLSTYYGNGTDGLRDSTALRETGDDGETVEMHTNQVRPVIANTMSLIVGQWPEVKPRAINEGSKALAETRLAAGLHDYYERKTSGRSRVMDTVRGGLLASSWNLGHSWAPSDGKEFAIGEDGTPIYEGDIQSFVLPPWRCVWDFAAADESSRKWVLFRRHVSRYDTAESLAAKQPELAEKLRRHVEAGSMWSRIASVKDLGEMKSLDSLLGEILPDEDVLWVWELRHLPTPALPVGRLVRFVEPDHVLFDTLGLEKPTTYPYEDSELHVREYSPERVVAGAAGHTAGFDLLGLQEFVDIATASMATTLNVNGQNRFWSGGDTGTNVRALGMNGAVVETQTKPEVLEFPAFRQDVMMAADWGINQLNSAMAINEVARGQPTAGMPAQAMALLKATAIQYHAVAQGDFVRLVEWNANSRLRLLKRFARTERTAQLVGKGRTYELKKWSEKDIANVAGFDVEPVNPSANSFESRNAIGEMFVERGMLSMEAYLTFVQTGNLEQGLATKTAQKELVESNVDMLQSGVGLPPVDMAQMQPLMEQWSMQSQQAAAMGGPPLPEPLPIFQSTPPGQKVLRLLRSDPHHLAIPAYLAVLSSPSSREDGELMKVATEVIQLSIAFWTDLSPDEAACYGIPPLPSQAMAAGMPPPGEGGPPGATETSEKPKGPPSGEGVPEEGDIEQPKDPTSGEAPPVSAAV